MKSTHKQRLNFWELTSILAPATGIAGLVYGRALIQQYGEAIAFSSIIIGNFIVWLTSLAIFSMSDKNGNALENIRSYLGKPAATASSLIWITSFSVWFIIQLDTTVLNFKDLFPNSSIFLICAIGLFGVLVTYVTSRGISLFKKYCVGLFPFIFAVPIYLLFVTASPKQIQFNLQVSLFGILSIVLIWLPLIINLPSLHRLSISKSHAILSLSLMFFFHTFFQLAFIFFHSESSILNRWVWIFFVLAICFIVNGLNIYFSAIAWKMLISTSRYVYRCLGVGAAATCLYFVLQIFSLSIVSWFTENLIASVISNLVVVLVADFLLKTIVRHRPRLYEKFWSTISWLAGCSVIIYIFLSNHSNNARGAMLGMSTSLLLFLVILFIEESFWSLKKVLKIPKQTR